jgi:hypothetical protein
VIYEFHPLANVLPLVEGAEFDDLVADIGAHGLREPIVTFDDKILDGRNRYRACAAGVEPIFTVYTGDDPVGYVISANLRRRHLDESQRAMVAARLTTLKLGDNQHSEVVPIGRGSELLKVGERTVARAREHSRKPDEAYALIEAMYPGLPKIELFARQQRPGWDVWGNETGKFGEVPTPSATGAPKGLRSPAPSRAAS